MKKKSELREQEQDKQKMEKDETLGEEVKGTISRWRFRNIGA